MFKLVIERLRVDLGNDNFADTHEAVGEVLLTSDSAKKLGQELVEFVNKRQGQIVETEPERIVFDTMDTTITVRLEGAGDEAISENDFAEFLSVVQI